MQSPPTRFAMRMDPSGFCHPGVPSPSPHPWQSRLPVVPVPSHPQAHRAPPVQPACCQTYQTNPGPRCVPERKPRRRTAWLRTGNLPRPEDDEYPARGTGQPGQCLGRFAPCRCPCRSGRAAHRRIPPRVDRALDRRPTRMRPHWTDRPRRSSARCRPVPDQRSRSRPWWPPTL